MGKREDQVGISTSQSKTPGGRRIEIMLKLSWKTRLKWFDHWLRREHNHICVKSQRVEVSVIRSRVHPKKRCRDNLKEDMNKF